MFFCSFCGHADYIHYMFVGRCIHGEMKPKDGKDCSCPEMDHQPVEESSIAQSPERQS